jgi:LysM repeat protein
MFCVLVARRGLGNLAKTGSLLISVAFLGGCGMNSLNLFDPGPTHAGDAQFTTGSITPSRRPSAMRAVYVQPGDTLNSFARENNSTPSQIVSANSLQPPYHLNIGQRLLVPGRTTRNSNVVPPTPEQNPPSRQGVVTGSISKPAPNAAPLEAPLRKVDLPPVHGTKKNSKRDQIYYFHKVAPGDTMPSIASHYKVDVNTLATFNQLSTSMPLRTGTIIKIPM